jgi:Tat protein translocase TatB subunit
MFGTLGGPEILLLLVLALIVFGPRKLPDIGKSMGKMLSEFRRASNDFRRTIEDEVEAEKMRDAMAEDRTAAAPALAPPAVADAAVADVAVADAADPAAAPAEAARADQAPRSEPASAPPVLAPPTESVSRENG